MKRYEKMTRKELLLLIQNTKNNRLRQKLVLLIKKNVKNKIKFFRYILPQNLKYLQPLNLWILDQTFFLLVE